MAIHDYDNPTEPLYRERFRNAVQDSPEEVDKATLWAGGMLAAAILIFIGYMLLMGPST